MRNFFKAMAEPENHLDQVSLRDCPMTLNLIQVVLLWFGLKKIADHQFLMLFKEKKFMEHRDRVF
jgi:hypothetical protein